MKILKYKTSLIKPYGKNAKKHPKDQVAKIANSIKAFGFKQPIVIDQENTIIVGHGRYEAAKLLKLDEVPCVLADDLSPEKIKAYRLADNKLNESEWVMDLVLEELKGLDNELVELTGFDLDLMDNNADVEFSLPDGEKGFAQITFTLTNEQAEHIKTLLAKAKKTTQYPNMETFSNENSNGNALYLICSEWEELNK